MIDELERIWKEVAVVLSTLYPGICLEGHESYECP
jgi:hypothetical protein